MKTNAPTGNWVCHTISTAFVAEVLETEQGEDQVYTWRKFAVVITVGTVDYQNLDSHDSRETAQAAADSVLVTGANLDAPEWYEVVPMESFRDYCERDILGQVSRA